MACLNRVAGERQDLFSMRKRKERNLHGVIKECRESLGCCKHWPRSLVQTDSQNRISAHCGRSVVAVCDSEGDRENKRRWVCRWGSAQGVNKITTTIWI